MTNVGEKSARIGVQIAVPAGWEAEIRQEMARELAAVSGAEGEVIEAPPDDDARFEPITAALWVAALVANSVGGYAISRALDSVFRRKAKAPTAARVEVLLPDGTRIEVSTGDPEALGRALTQVRAALDPAAGPR